MSRASRLLPVALTLLALALGAGLALAAGSFKAGRSYEGAIAAGGKHGFDFYVGSPVQFSVAANGKTVTSVAAVYSTCSNGGGLGNEQISFPNSKIVHGAFKSTFKRPTRAGLYARITIKGKTSSRGKATGTISGATNINSITGQKGPACVTSNPWSAKAKPRGFGVCDPVKYGTNQIAMDISEDRTTCKVVDKAIRAGKLNQLTGKFTTPGWKCHQATIKPGPNTTENGNSCTRHRTSFQFV